MLRHTANFVTSNIEYNIVCKKVLIDLLMNCVLLILSCI